MTNLKNKIVLISGASSGIGAACAHQFAALGCRLILLARREEKLQALQTTLKQSYQTESRLIVLDLMQTTQIAPAIAALEPEWQNIDILLNNAGLAAGLASFAESKRADIEMMIDTNVKALIYLTQAVLPVMLQRQIGHVINIGSIAGRLVYPNGAVYCASKHAVRALTQGLKIDVFGTPIRVSSVDPGMVETEFSIVRFSGDQEKAKAVYQDTQPLTAADIAETVIFCATRPPHVNISEILVMPTDQDGVTRVRRDTE